MNQKVFITLQFFVVISLATLMLSGCGAPAGSAEDGKRWYTMNNCSSCHGLHGNDGRAIDIAGIDMGFGRFVRILRRTDAPIMPFFPESKISKQDAADIYAYLKSVEK
ncbi:cytochrome c [Desulforhopalus sp. IMCC35007]|uniref:c-type cytochrome n=1 Tax=Desulforhopalus sp. IMCC35007 TaxID=2569543 RepID=UPI00145E3F01|nr:cytochrome c [Desulforhopalus sp. IMCC35007]